MIELLVVITIIGLLGTALSVSVQSGYKQARQANCKSNLKQFGIALMIYRGEHDNVTPDWISNLYPDYVDDRGLYVCRADSNKGKSSPRPETLVRRAQARNDTDTAPFWDNAKNSDSTRNQTIQCCSYLYEFSHATAPGSWWGSVNWPQNQKPTGKLTMGQYKLAQMQYGDSSSKSSTGVILPYSASRIPIIRCYHHWDDEVILGYNSGSASRESKQFVTINVAYAGNVFVGPLYWEKTIYPGEQTSSSGQ